MARVLAVPSDVWDQLHDMLSRGIWFYSDADNASTRSEAILVGRRERALEQAEKVGADVWEFATGKGSKGSRYFFIAKDEAELRARIAVAQVMAV